MDFLGTSLVRAVKSRSPGILHLPGIWGASSSAAWLLARMEGDLPLVVSPQGMLERERTEVGGRSAFAWRVWNGHLLRSAKCLHALCDEEASSIAAVLPGAPICVIPNGVDLPGGAPVMRSDAEHRVMLFMDRIHPRKGLVQLIEAWARAPGTIAGGWRLIIAGWDDGGHEQALRTRAETLGLGSNVSFVGPVAGAAKEELFRRASAFILPSFSEDGSGSTELWASSLDDRRMPSYVRLRRRRGWTDRASCREYRGWPREFCGSGQARRTRSNGRSRSCVGGA